MEPPRSVIVAEEMFEPAKIADNFSLNLRIEEMVMKLANVMTRSRTSRKQRVGKSDAKLVEFPHLLFKNPTLAAYDRKLNKTRDHAPLALTN